MATIERINQMRQQGFQDSQIIQGLKEQGLSPKEINEALEQSKVKSAVSNEEMQPSMMQQTDSQDYSIIPEQQGSQQATQMPGQQPAQQMTQEVSGQPMSEQYPGQTYQEYAPEQSPGYESYQPQAYDTETISEIAEQIVSEKTEKLQKHLQEIQGFKTEIQGKVDNIDERLKRIETMIDRLQTSILGKIGDYGRNLSDLKQEMVTTQDSFSKILEPLKKIAGESTSSSTKQKSEMTGTEKSRGKPRAKVNKGGDGFEHYLRG